MRTILQSAEVERVVTEVKGKAVAVEVDLGSSCGSYHVSDVRGEDPRSQGKPETVESLKIAILEVYSKDSSHDTKFYIFTSEWILQASESAKDCRPNMLKLNDT